MNKIYRLTVTAKEIRGRCPVFDVGDKIIIEEPRIILKKTDACCIHALGSMLTTMIALSRGVSFKELGLSKDDHNVGYVQCLDPGLPYTEGGTVIFEIKQETMQ